MSDAISLDMEEAYDLWLDSRDGQVLTCIKMPLKDCLNIRKTN